MRTADPSLPPVVSVVVPSYNHLPYLEAAISSALKTTLPMELVVVDDGSTDGSAALLTEWATREPRLRVYCQENAGAHAALNRAISLARGPLVAILNSDDVYLPGRLEKLCTALLDQPGCALAGTWLEVIDTEGRRLGIKEGWKSLPPPWQKPGGLSALGDPALALLESNYFSTTSNVVFRRELAGPEPFRALRYAHDWDFILRLTGQGGLLFFEETLVQYRVHPTNTIKEGADDGRGWMNFEILWLLAAHARRILATRSVDMGLPDLEARILAGLPHFGRPDLLWTLLALRGGDEEIPPAYLALLEPQHPLRRRCIAELKKAET